MKISDEVLEVSDLDWFAVDQNGLLGHFATGRFGGVPKSILESKESLQEIEDYFRKHVPKTKHCTIHPKWSDNADIDPKDSRSVNMYLNDFKQMASCGLYSYDAYNTGPRPSSYFLVAFPDMPLSIKDLPDNIRQMIERTPLPDVSFRFTSEIVSNKII
ncbi:MAG TPA: hypothetical protein DCY03_28780 [Planctomycetaceae bacterium]|uniref:hypothetical protein n=1 Tax=Gimesia maris TaxID=122 RepID=UPI000E878F97|nr:hypothetical protein [Planctomycetaceae bacterium]|tara:strand:+ start:8277 stop:8753 length:477 start_codon:yes stop_codon:yes gene_type:complete